MQETPYPAPDFDLEGTDQKHYKLSDYKGKWLVIYFYPKDDTPGCTVEACSLRDSNERLRKMGVEILGVSRDSNDSHNKFRDKHGLEFPLLSDPDAEMIRAYGAWGAKMFGREGIQRKTFIINPEGMVVKVYGRVTPLGHGEQVADEIARLQTK